MLENLIEIFGCRLGRSWAALGAAKTRETHISDGFWASLGAEVFKLFKVCGLGDGYKAAKTLEIHISEFFYEKKASESTKKALCPRPRPSWPRSAGERLGPQEGSERGKKNLVEKPS